MQPRSVGCSAMRPTTAETRSSSYSPIGGTCAREPARRSARSGGRLPYEAVGSAPLQRRLIGGPRLESRDPGIEVGIRRRVPERHRQFTDEAHLDVRGSQLAAQKIVAAGEAIVDEL